MPRYTQLCTRCAWFGDIWAQPYHNPPCPACGGETERTWAKMPERVMITRDEIPGGVTLENYGHEPVTFYSHSERRAYMKAHGLQEMVRHVGVPGSDKSPYTTSWATSDPYTLEQARLLLERLAAHWSAMSNSASASRSLSRQHRQSRLLLIAFRSEPCSITRCPQQGIP